MYKKYILLPLLIIFYYFFNTAKSVALRISPLFKHVCAPLVLAGADLEYVHETK